MTSAVTFGAWAACCMSLWHYAIPFSRCVHVHVHVCVLMIAFTTACIMLSRRQIGPKLSAARFQHEKMVAGQPRMECSGMCGLDEPACAATATMFEFQP